MSDAVRISERVIGAGITHDIAPLVARFGLGRKLLLVCDDTTWLAAGEGIFARHTSSLDIRPHSLGRYVKAEMKHIEPLIEAAQDQDAILAVGAGTVNDLAKYAAAKLNKPYICVATAASMNGYTSATSSIEENGVKISFPTVPPRAVLVDVDILVAAPRKLAHGGLGDTLCRTTVEADMLLSHCLLGTPYPGEAFDCLRKHEKDLTGNVMRLIEGDPTYLSLLMEALLDAGDWMARTGSSAIASQGEHMIAHTIEMLYADQIRQALHGELVSVATVAYGHLQHKMLLGQPTAKALPRDEAQFNRMFGRKNGPRLAAMYARKLLGEEQVAEVTARLADWQSIRERLQKIMRSPLTVERVYTQGNVPLLPKQIGLSEDRFASAFTYAYMTRDRFTFLDLAAMTGKRI